jgi:hypothetical protein
MTITTQSFLSVGVGSSANDGTGDDLRTAFQKVNANFGWMGNTGFNAANINATSIDVAGPMISSGSHVETGYVQLKPTANVAVTASVNTNRLLLHPTGTIISFGANVTLPNTQADGTIFSISSNVTISQLSIQPNWNGVVTVSPFGNISAVTAGNNTRYMYIAADFRWYRIA